MTPRTKLFALGAISLYGSPRGPVVIMQYRTVGRTRTRISVVGFGTAQLQLVPQQQALETLHRGFELGVNWVHTAPDYGGADVLVARAIREGHHRDVVVFSNASGPVEHFGWVFEKTCRLLGRDRLAMFGISGIDYCEHLGQNVWEAGGLVSFLLEMRRQGRLGGLFCTTHGAPEYVSRLIHSGCFDAIMLAYNPLGFHLLSYDGRAEGKDYEDLERNRSEIFPLAKKHGVSLLVMKPLAGGLLCPSTALPRRDGFPVDIVAPNAADILRAILREPGVTAVVPGTASVEEAQANASAGHSIPDQVTQLDSVDRAARTLNDRLCSRCGLCEPTCSRSLPISWLFREGYLWNFPSHTVEAIGRKHYFKLHPDEVLACSSCVQRRCHCPAGLDIPRQLRRIHAGMLALRRQGILHATPEELQQATISGPVPVRIVCRETPQTLLAEQEGVCRLWLENAGDTPWWSFWCHPEAKSSLALRVKIDDRDVATIALLHDVGPGQRTHMTFAINAPRVPGLHALGISLARVSPAGSLREGTPLLTEPLSVVDKQ